MTKFTDQLFDDLMREHGSMLANARPPAPRRHVPGRRTLLATGAGCTAVAAVAGVLVANGGTHAVGTGTHVAKGAAPAYAVTKNPDGTITLDVYKTSGIALANARLRQLDDGQVVIVPVKPGCPTPDSLPAPAVPPSGPLSVQGSMSTKDGSLTVNAQGIPAGDILVVGVQTVSTDTYSVTSTGSKLTSPPAPSCISLPPLPQPPPGSGGSGHRSGHASGSSLK